MRRERIRTAVTFTLLSLLALYFLFPVYWMFVGSFKEVTGAVTGDFSIFLPINLHLRNYVDLFDSNPVGLWIFNSFVVAGGATITVVVTNTMAGYAFAKKRFIGRAVLFAVIVSTLMLPRQILIVPLFMLMSRLGISRTYWAIMLPAMAWPIGIFLMRQFIKTIPTPIIESAVIDGCSEIALFTRIVFPLAKPGIVALVIFTFINVWVDFLWQFIIISSRRLVTIPVGVAGLQLTRIPEYGASFSGAAIASLPMIVVFFIFQRFFTRGVTLGAVKE